VARSATPLKVGKGKTAISCSVIDERLGVALAAVEAWVARNAGLVEWVRPDAGGMCCVRLKGSAFDDAGVEGFYRLAAKRLINLATGDRFLDERRVFRLGFGALPIATFERALAALEDTCRSAANGESESR